MSLPPVCEGEWIRRHVLWNRCITSYVSDIFGRILVTLCSTRPSTPCTSNYYCNSLEQLSHKWCWESFGHHSIYLFFQDSHSLLLVLGVPVSPHYSSIHKVKIFLFMHRSVWTLVIYIINAIFQTACQIWVKMNSHVHSTPPVRSKLSCNNLGGSECMWLFTCCILTSNQASNLKNTVAILVPLSQTL